jgi:hypothetical protein
VEIISGSIVIPRILLSERERLESERRSDKGSGEGRM